MKKRPAATLARSEERQIRKKLAKNERQAAKNPHKQWPVDQQRERLPAAKAKADDANLEGQISKNVQPAKERARV